MEAERKSLGLRGLLFRYYSCAACGHADIFVVLYQLERESTEEFRQRRQELEEAVGNWDLQAATITLLDRAPLEILPLDPAYKQKQRSRCASTDENLCLGGGCRPPKRARTG